MYERNNNRTQVSWNNNRSHKHWNNKGNESRISNRNNSTQRIPGEQMQVHISVCRNKGPLRSNNFSEFMANIKFYNRIALVVSEKNGMIASLNRRKQKPMFVTYEKIQLRQIRQFLLVSN